MSAPKAIIFDLGNVLLPIDLSLTYEAFAAYSSLSSSEIASAILEHQLWVPYEAGQQTDVEFRDFLRLHLDLTISDADFDNAFSALLLDGAKKDRPRYSYFKNVKSIWLSVEVFNLLGIQNTLSYLWIQDQSSNKTYAVPNRLTSRLLNVKLVTKF